MSGIGSSSGTGINNACRSASALSQHSVSNIHISKPKIITNGETDDIPLSDEKEKDVAQSRNRKGEICKAIFKFLFSHIGLCCMVIAYSVAGGFIFQLLEQTNEKEECVKAEEKYLPLENSTTHKLYEVGQNFPEEENMELALDEFQKLLRRFRDDVLALEYDGKNCSNMGGDGGPAYQWSFSGALLFSVTVITTVGYGHIAPKTYWGRLVCIAYALLGIPLMLLWLANIGDVMADIFRYVYCKVCCCGCCRRKKKPKSEDIQSEEDRVTPEAWKANYNKQANTEPIVVDDFDEDDMDDYQEISVPLTVTLLVLIGYIFLGALLFIALEEDWDTTQSAYFSFVTISTIGFGDVVPGATSLETANDNFVMAVTAIYSLFGMAIISMCFSLIQGEIVGKFKWLGEKLGLLTVEKEEDGVTVETLEDQPPSIPSTPVIPVKDYCNKPSRSQATPLEDYDQPPHSAHGSRVRSARVHLE